MINTKAQEDKKVETLLTKAQVNIIDLAHCGEYLFIYSYRVK